MTFWDDFTDDGALTSDSPAVSPVGSIAVTQSLPAGGETSVTFLLAWHFPNRTPDRCGWPAPEAEEKTAVVGNYYCQRFTDAWEVARHVAQQLPSLEERSRRFAAAVESSTLPPAALDAALSNLSTLRTNTAFRTADGEFHGFEGCDDQVGMLPRDVYPRVELRAGDGLRLPFAGAFHPGIGIPAQHARRRPDGVPLLPAGWKEDLG